MTSEQIANLRQYLTDLESFTKILEQVFKLIHEKEHRGSNEELKANE